MKKSVVIALILALCIPGIALAENSFWTRSDDLYYHGVEKCGGAEGRVPISAEAALAFDKYTCPVCCSYEDEGEEPCAVARGGTIVVRFSDAWLSKLELTDIFGLSGNSHYSGNQAQRRLSQYLHAGDYAAFVQAYLKDGSGEGRGCMPEILPRGGILTMSRRHIGNDWYVIVRPGESFKNKWDMQWRVNSFSLKMDNGILAESFDRQSVEETRTLKPKNMSGSSPVYERSTDEMEVAVYRGLDGNIAVIREKKPSGRQLENVQLSIGEEIVADGLSGYEDGSAAVYCCVVTDGELAAFEKNAKIAIRHVEPVNGEIYRVAEAEAYGYYTADTDESLFSVDLENGRDPVDASFRIVLDGIPDCFAVQTDGLDYIMDYSGNEYHPGFWDTNSPQRITPLVWYGETGIFLAEDYQGESFAVGEYLLPDGIELGRFYELEKNRGDGYYHCWLMNEKGETILGANRDSFAVFENGEIHIRSIDGEIAIYSPGT